VTRWAEIEVYVEGKGPSRRVELTDEIEIALGVAGYRITQGQYRITIERVRATDRSTDRLTVKR
jgi:hypothetical protein